jgi:thioredoxin 1
MKKTIFTLIILVALMAFASKKNTASTPITVGITFFEGSWAELLAEAKKANKPFFVDVYTTWCGPCKMMARTTFADEEVGKFVKNNFLAYKIDAEKGEGTQIADEHKVRSYPTVLFFDANGKYLGKEVGFMNDDKFLYVLDKFLQKKK